VSNGNTSYTDGKWATSSTGQQRWIGTIANQRIWSGADTGSAEEAGSSSPSKVLRRTLLSVSISGTDSREARIGYLNDLEAEAIRGTKVKVPREPLPYGSGTLGGYQRNPNTPDRPPHLEGSSLWSKGPVVDIPVRNGFAVTSKKPHRRRHGGSENAYTCTRQTSTAVMMQWWQSGVGPVTDSTELIHSGLSYLGLGRNASALLNANDDIRLVNKLRDHLNGSDFNMSVLLGESHQTLKMIGDAALRIAKSGWHLRKGDIAGATASLVQGANRKPLKPRGRKGHSGDLANNWLELQYGWLPLLNDVADGAKSLAHHLNVPMRRTYRVKVDRTIQGWVQPQLPLDVGVRDWHYHKKVLIAKVKEYDNSVPALLGLKDPELVAWELLPFSFVADWFVPIGSWLEARALSSKLTGTFITCDLKKYSLRGMVSTKYGPAYPVLEKSQYDRTIASSLNVRMPQYKGLKAAASWQHCTNAIALMTQVFTGQKVRKFD
jgi:hypothetical protein